MAFNNFTVMPSISLVGRRPESAGDVQDLVRLYAIYDGSSIPFIPYLGSATEPSISEPNIYCHGLGFRCHILSCDINILPNVARYRPGPQDWLY